MVLTFVFVNRFPISLHICIPLYSQLKIGFYFKTLLLRSHSEVEM